MNLDDDHYCRVWGTAMYPDICRRFAADAAVCGQTRDEAMVLLTVMEKATRAPRL